VNTKGGKAPFRNINCGSRNSFFQARSLCLQAPPNSLGALPS